MLDLQDVRNHKQIPKEEEAKAKWFVVIGREVNKHSAICSRHFEEKDFRYKVVRDTVLRLLAPTAVPSLLLTQTDSKNALSKNIKLAKPSSEESIVSELNPHVIYTKDNSKAILPDVPNPGINVILSTSNSVDEVDTSQFHVNIEFSTLDDSQSSVDNTENIGNAEITTKSKLKRLDCGCNINNKFCLMDYDNFCLKNIATKVILKVIYQMYKIHSKTYY